MTTPFSASVPAKGANLTYCDVQLILALLDSWRGGSLRFAKGELSVEALLDAGGAVGSSSILPSSRVIVRSPGVGIFQQESSFKPGLSVNEGTVIGTIAAPGRTMPVKAGTTGCLIEFLVATGEFVEYGQALAAISATPK
jgi:biotin carboxyl carrier protein